MRTEYGFSFSQTDIRPLIGQLSESSADFSNQVGDSFFFGADFVAVEETTLATYAKHGGRSFARDEQSTFDIVSGNFYVEARLAPEKLSLYFDETITPAGASSREAFMILQATSQSSYLKVGRILLPYGVRLRDDATFIRQVTGFNFDNQDMGVEIGYAPGRTSFNVAFSNGTQGGRDDNIAKQISSVGSVYFKYMIVGGSFAMNESRGIDRMLMGPFASMRLGPLTLTGEADWLHESGAREQDQFIAYASANYWLRQSLNFRVAFDFLDPYDGIKEDERSRVVAGVEGFLTPNLTAGAHYTNKTSVPQDPDGNADILSFSLHTFF